MDTCKTSPKSEKRSLFKIKSTVSFCRFIPEGFATYDLKILDVNHFHILNLFLINSRLIFLLGTEHLHCSSSFDSSLKVLFKGVRGANN